MSRILVTGGAGFIGSHVVDAYIGAGHEVVVIDDLSTGKQQNLNTKARFHRMDIREPGLDDLFSNYRFEVVNHQAARCDVRQAMHDPLLYAEVNICGGLNVLECCRKYNIRKIIYASTGGCVYGEPSYLPADEKHPVKPLDPYGASKAAYEVYLALYGENYGLKYTVLRYANVYGPRQNPFGDAGVVSIFIGQMLRGIKPTINGDGEQVRDYVFVGDVIRANLLAIENGDGEIFNLSSARPTSVNQIFQLLRMLLDLNIENTYGPAKLGEVRKIYLDNSKAAALLGWNPFIGLEDGLRQTVRFFQQQPGG